MTGAPRISQWRARAALLAASLLLPAYAEERAAEWHEEACAAGAGGCAEEEDPSLSLRQLRATARHDPALVEQTREDPAQAGDVAADPAKIEGAAAVDAGADDEDYDPGLPGGWGEAADFVDEAEAEEKADYEGPKNATLEAQFRWGSCARYRCVSYYVRMHGCQCNSGCVRHGSCCSDYYAKCHHHHHVHAPAPAPAPAPSSAAKGKTMTLYHQTGGAIGPLILANGFKPGTQGWCGGGIYFATSAEATNTKAIGPDSHKGYLIAADVDVGKVMYKTATCDRGLNVGKVHTAGYDSVSFNPGDGQEYIVYSNSRIHNIRHIPMPR